MPIPMPIPTAEPIIDIHNLHITLPSLAGNVNILKGLSLQIGQGEAVGVTGPSGCGKTTMLMALAGLETVTQGKIIMAGQPLAALTEDGLARFRRDHIGIVFQSFHLVPTMTALENVALPLELSKKMGKKTAEIFDHARAGLEEVGLGHRHDHYPSQLSGGEQQRVALARAMIANPPIMLADEPTGNLDQNTGAQIMDLMLDLKTKRGTTLVLITHDPILATRCDRVIKLRDGQLDA